MRTEVHDANRWPEHWRGTLLELDIFAMDLSNHPHDRLATLV